jgi:hypothetical protein
MGREEKRKKQARRDRRRRDDEYGKPGMTMHVVRTEEEALAALYGPGPASNDWRADVLGRKRLSLRLRRDGKLAINGHLLTREMCAALQKERPDDAKDFDFDTLREMGRDMVPGLEMRRPAP